MTTEEANAKLACDLKAVVEDAEQLMRATANQAGDKLKEVRGRLASTLASAKETCQGLEEKAISAAEATDQCVRNHPYESIGVAFGLGLLVGILFSRR